MSRAAPETTELLDFARRFCAVLGARLEPAGPAWRMELPAGLKEHFGKESLTFALTAHDAWVSGAEILAPGSYLLERMYEYLKDRGVRTTFLLPATISPTPAEARREVLSRVHVGHASVDSVHTTEAWPVRVAVDFKLVYHTDEREEELLRIVEEEDGSRRAADSEPGPSWAGAVTAPADVVAKVSIGDLNARYEAIAAEARRVAVSRARPFERAALQRLAENLSRIRGYFEQIRGEISGDDERRSDRLRELVEEERLKTGEELDAHRLRVRLEPLALALLAVPTRRVVLHVRGATGEAAELPCDLCLATGKLSAAGLGEVPSVEDGGLRLELCHDGHLVAEREASPCTSCGRLGCGRHGTACPECGDRLCGSCGRLCGLCHERYCGKHEPRPCAVCGKAACGRCAGSCAACGETACRDDATPCAVCARPACRRHAVACGCGETVCPDDVVVDEVSGIRYCGKCAVRCADCQRAIGKVTSQLCAACGQRLCREHALPCAQCPGGKAKLCGDHRTRCNACGKDLCRARHRRRCRSCTMDVCAGCLDAASRCRLCADVHRLRSAAVAPPVAELPAEARGVKEWHGAAGSVTDVFWGKTGRGEGVLLLVGKDGRLGKTLKR